MLQPNPYFFFRPLKEADLVTVVQWMGTGGRLAEDREGRALRHLKRQVRDPGNAVDRRSWMAMRCGLRNFLLELTVTGELYLTGPAAIHANPWRALEAWGYSIPWVFAEAGTAIGADAEGGTAQAAPGLPAYSLSEKETSPSKRELPELRIPLPESRVAEIKALKRLGCRRIGKEVDFEEEVWVWGVRK